MTGAQNGKKNSALWLVCTHIHERQASGAFCHDDNRTVVCQECERDREMARYQLFCPACLLELFHRLNIQPHNAEQLVEDASLGHTGHL